MGTRWPHTQRILDKPRADDFWQADHEIAVAEGGGACGLENLRTLCTPCHRQETSELRSRLKERRQSGSFSENEDSVSSARGRPVAKSRPHSARGSETASSKGWRPNLTVPRGPTCASPEALQKRRSTSAPPNEAEDVRESSVDSRASRTATPRNSRPTTPSRQAAGARGAVLERGEAARQPTPERRARAQPTRTATPERQGPPTREVTPKRRDAAEAARQAAMAARDQATRRDKNCIFRKREAGTSAGSSQTQDAPPNASSATTLLSASTGSGIELRRSESARKMRPSFGSSAPRF